MVIGLYCCGGSDERRKVMLAQAGVTLPLVFSQKVASLMMRKIASAQVAAKLKLDRGEVGENREILMCRVGADTVVPTRNSKGWEEGAVGCRASEGDIDRIICMSAKSQAGEWLKGNYKVIDEMRWLL
ncbi:hypothetical protein Q8A73_001906 [Channa argus]|nr:hypothetical protein Q8A73_001906 [Channa argus]